jgi:aminoglycoside phosphotransferase family enzyme
MGTSDCDSALLDQLNEGSSIVHRDVSMTESRRPTLAAKVEFLGRAAAYPEHVHEVICRETHMSWVFLAGDKVFKLKKPVRFSYLDFSTLARRQAMCRTELRLNRRLAPDIYLDVVPLVLSAQGLSIGGPGEAVDWLVVMRRLEEHWALDRAIEEGRVKASQLDRLVTTLGKFYRHAARPFLSPAAQLNEWHYNISRDCRVLLDLRLDLPAGLVRTIERVQRRFLEKRAGTLIQRVRDRRIVDGHGDLRPEHIWLTDGIKIIDCLEFNPRLRMVDPFDEIAYLSLECERLGATWIGDYVRRGVARALHDDPRRELFLFYRCHRAALRARLAVAHLLEPNPRTPEKWPRRARAYLRIAARDAVHLERLLRTPTGR